VKIADFVSSDNQDNCLVIKGIPFRIKNDEIIEFFSSCGTLTSDKIYIDQVDGRKSGSALVIFENSDAV
jgi:RNA recognition motif-containing protein